MRILNYERYKITQSYNGDIKGGHTGVDIIGEGSGNTKVLAHSRGKVVAVQTGAKNNTNASGISEYGNYVKILHPNGMYTLYAHLNNVIVKPGDDVKKSDEIGIEGDSGRAFGVHLHFEVRNKDNYVINPTSYLEADLPDLKEDSLNYEEKYKKLKEELKRVLEEY